MINATRAARLDSIEDDLLDLLDITHDDIEDDLLDLLDSIEAELLLHGHL